MVSSFSDFEGTFGSTFVSGGNSYTYLTSETARQYLKSGNKLTVFRVMPGSPTVATSEVSDNIGQQAQVMISSGSGRTRFVDSSILHITALQSISSSASLTGSGFPFDGGGSTAAAGSS